jgi:hypothetical protein
VVPLQGLLHSLLHFLNLLHLVLLILMLAALALHVGCSSPDIWLAKTVTALLEKDEDNELTVARLGEDI